ncbi:Hypothetical predicted protein [Pelobates cultripes]|uniref:Uncharacterized protein n=1 Tax=Pelobates cultripes TaxID=61616 RepID=A0AAD1S906_PELCU|nr:Hypothetical predicted protein [Pelobates cultripes]
MHAADMDLLRTKMQAVTAHTQVSEEDILDMRQEVTGLKVTFQQLLTSHSTLTSRVDLAEERNRRTNLKLRGIPDSINTTELPHYLRLLTNTLLPHTQAKKIAFDRFFRIKKPRQAPTKASQDVIIPCQSLTDKNRVESLWYFITHRSQTPSTWFTNRSMTPNASKHLLYTHSTGLTPSPTT